MAHILVIEDDARIGALVLQLLARSGFTASLADRGDDGLARIIAEQPDLVLLDINLPGLDGLSVCRRAREKYAGPIIMLTAQDDPIDEVVGLEIGADDYICKPMNPRVLLARIRARLRQPGGALDAAPPTQGLHIDPTRREVWVDGRSIELTTAEFDLLVHLADRRGEVVDRDALYLALRGVPHDGLDRSIDLRVARLRRLLGDDPKAPKYIKTVRGVGYLLMAPLLMAPLLMAPQ
ncbi:MAG: two-component system response regulator RstA [Bradymonadia bacterium]